MLIFLLRARLIKGERSFFHVSPLRFSLIIIVLAGEEKTV